MWCCLGPAPCLLSQAQGAMLLAISSWAERCDFKSGAAKNFGPPSLEVTGAGHIIVSAGSVVSKASRTSSWETTKKTSRGPRGHEKQPRGRGRGIRVTSFSHRWSILSRPRRVGKWEGLRHFHDSSLFRRGKSCGEFQREPGLEPGLPVAWQELSEWG